MKRIIHFSRLLPAAAVLLLFSCRSIDTIAIEKISEIMASDSGSGAFTRDDDPELVADALPFALKVYEMLIGMNPEDDALKLAGGKAFIMYANAFIQTPAGMLPDEEYLEQDRMLKRARKMYLRGRNYILDGLSLRFNDFDELMEDNPDGLLEEADEEDVPYLYWAAAGWLGAFSCDPFDLEMGSDIHLPVAFLYRSLELDEEFESGAVHDLLITLWSSLPQGLIENAFISTPETAGRFSLEYYRKSNVNSDPEERARFHFSRAVELADGKNPGSYISMATGFPVSNQNYDEFEALLTRALEIDPYENPDTQLTVMIYQDKARWYLEHREDYFLMDFEE